MTETEVIKLLSANAKKRKAAQERYRVLKAEADALVVEGDQLGIQRTSLARIAQLTKPTVYAILLRHEAGRGA